MRHMLCVGLWAALSLAMIGFTRADEGDSDQGTSNQSQGRRNNAGSRQDGSSDSSVKRSSKASRQSNADDNDEVRIRYSDDDNRLDIHVDDEISLGNPRNRKWERNGEFELRYDADQNDMQVSGQGTIDVDRAANAMARWWQSWWEEERTARRSQRQGAQSGARVFLNQHDENGDGYLSRRELPAQDRADFQDSDRDGDGYLDLSEIRNYGNGWYNASSRVSNPRRNPASSRNSDRDNQTWSQWWASWWSGQDDGDQDTRDIAAQGVREFLRRHDSNGDGSLSRSELPDRMYDDFDQLDDNGDRLLSRMELRNHAEEATRNASRRGMHNANR